MKVSVSTSIEEDFAKRVAALADKELTSEAAIIRKCVVKYLPQLEREILGAAFVGHAEEPDPKEVVNG